jgi:hypothetical protein
MNDLGNVLYSLVSAVLLIACFWWANAVLAEWGQVKKLGLSGGTRLFIVIALGGLVFAPLMNIASGFIAILFDYNATGEKIVEIGGSIAALVFLGWLYTRAILGR